MTTATLATPTPEMLAAADRFRTLMEGAAAYVACNDVHACNHPEVIAGIMRPIVAEHAQQEGFYALLLSPKLAVIGSPVLITLGLADRALVHAREVFKPAILAGATGVALCHNHPSGDAWPSREDSKVTRRLIEAGRVLGIQVVDHIIVGLTGDYFSFREKCPELFEQE